MEGFTASKYKQLVSDKKPKINTEEIDKALIAGLEKIAFYQQIHPDKEGLEKEINAYLEKYKDNFNKIVAKVENIKDISEHGLTMYDSDVVFSIVQKPAESNYLKEQGKKFEKESKKVSKYNKNKQ